MQRKWWFLSAKRDGFSLSGAGGACGFLCICALNGAEFLKLAVHKCFCFFLVSIPIRILFLISLPSWWTLEKTMCKGDEVVLYFCFFLTSILLRLLFPVSFTSWWTLKRMICGWDEIALYFCFSFVSTPLRVFEGCAFPRATRIKSSVLQGTKAVFNCDRLSALTEQMRKQWRG